MSSLPSLPSLRSSLSSLPQQVRSRVGAWHPSGFSRAAVVRIAVTGVIALALLVLLLSRVLGATRTVVATQQQLQHTHQSLIGRLVGHPAPDFTITVWNGAAGNGGETVHLAALHGKPVVINFWASWCEPCQGEAPILAHAAKTYAAQGVVFVGVALETQPADGQQFVRQYGIPYPCGPAPDSVAVAYGLTGIPVTVAINAQGILVQQINGPITTSSLDAAIRAALK
jgi:cytochrome c biogenesis protein CcmG/thiol:disulfide interchange protein DsbE